MDDVVSHPGGQQQARQPWASYDRYKELINTWVIVSKYGPEKGLYGRIRDHLGNQIMRIEARLGARIVDLHVNSLMNA